MMAVSTVQSVREKIAEVAAEMGYRKVKERQYEVIEKFVGGNDVFVSLPTGSGKSLCFAMLPKVFDSLFPSSRSACVLIVSPLVSLMKEQVSIFGRKGLTAIYVNDEDSKLSLLSGTLAQLIYVSPETLLTDREFRDILESPVIQESIKALIVDEAHCVKKW